MKRLLPTMAAALIALAIGSANNAQAQNWPAKPVKVVIPLTAGSATDVMARIVFDQVSQQVGQPFIIENRPGAGNSIGMNAVAKAEPDGYTILANSSTHSVSPAVRATMPLDTVNDLSAIIPFGNMPVVMAFSPKRGFKTLKEYVDWAKALSLIHI